MKLRVLTYNIHKCIGGIDRRYDPERIASVIEHYAPDLVLLQEVDQFANRSRGDRQVEWLGERLGLRHRAFFPNVKVRGGGEYGNAILSRFPVTRTENIDLTIPPKKRRSALHTRSRIRLPNERGSRTRTLHIFNLHLGLSGIERRLQVQRLLQQSSLTRLHRATPILIAGDLNDVFGVLGPKFFLPAGFRGIPNPIATFPAIRPLRALDGIYVRGDLELQRAQRGRLELAKQASDHRPLIADLSIPS